MSPFVGSLLAAKWHLGEGSSAIRQGSSNHSNGRFGGAGRVSVCSGISIDFHCILLSLLRHQSFARFNLSVSTSCIFQRINAAIQLGSSITSPCHVFHMIQHVLKIYNQVYSIGTRMHFKYIYIYLHSIADMYITILFHPQLHHSPSPACHSRICRDRSK